MIFAKKIHPETNSNISYYRDLLIEMRKNIYDWSRVEEILNTSRGAGDDLLMQQVYRHVGDFYMERQEWENAASYYERSSHNYAELVKCYLMMDDFARMEALGQRLPDGSEVLKVHF